MNAFTRLVSSLTEGHEAAGVAPGSDRVGRGMQPPQAHTRADDDAAVRSASAMYIAATGRRPDRRLRLRLGTMAHYGFSAGLGVGYVLLADRFPAIRRGMGTLYGGAVWAVADEGLMPAFNLSRGPREQSAGMHAYSLAGHAVYGATLECARLILRGDRQEAAARSGGQNLHLEQAGFTRAGGPPPSRDRATRPQS
jgi:uncharacterized membrane protein YagU involved in acid resistance